MLQQLTITGFEFKLSGQAIKVLSYRKPTGFQGDLILNSQEM